MNKISKKLDMIISLTLAILGIIVYRATFFLRKPLYEPLGSAFFPRIVSIILVILSIILFIRSILVLRKRGHSQLEETQIEESQPLMFIILLGLLCLYILILPHFGFLATTFLFLMISMMLLTPKARRSLRMIGIVVFLSWGTAFLIYVIFQKFLNVMLP